MPRKNLILFLAILFVIALGLSRAFSQEKYYVQMRTFTNILDLVMQHYVEEVKPDDVNKLFESAYNGMLGQLDPYSQYLNVRDTQTFSEDTEGEFGGLGIEISIQDGVLTVISPIRDTPAWDAGIQAGDVILKIDGRSTERILLQEALKLLRGKPGSKVTLTIRHMNGLRDEEVVLVRAVIKPVSVEYGIIDAANGIGLLRVVSFNAQVIGDLEKGVQEMKAAGLKGLVLDLRGNPGGLLDVAVKMCDEFLADGDIVSVRGRHKARDQVFSAKKGQMLEDMPLVVLIDGGSASASEIVAGCMRDRARAILVGSMTYGKGSVQNVIPIGEGAALKLTTARYYTPDGHPIKDREGIQPDIPVPMSREHRMALISQEREDKLRGRYSLGSNLEEGAASPEGGAAAPENGDEAPKPDARRFRVVDYQLKAAVNILKWGQPGKSMTPAVAKP